MFKLIKLAAYGLAGYTLYQIYLSVKNASSGRVAERELARDLGGGERSGPGRGKTEQTEESSGLSDTHAIGRGASM